MYSIQYLDSMIYHTISHTAEFQYMAASNNCTLVTHNMHRSHRYETLNLPWE